jgi:DNA-binding beta-propeller fold protein YncE
MHAVRFLMLSVAAGLLVALQGVAQMPQDHWYEVCQFGAAGTNASQFDHPYGIALDTNGLIYVADSWNNRIQVFQPSGTFVRQWGTSGAAPGQLGWPWALAFDTNGLLYVTENYNNRVQVFGPTGAWVRAFGSFGTGAGQMWGPSGVAFGPTGLVYVTDYCNNRVEIFRPDGTFVSAWGSSGTTNGQFQSPCGIAVDADGNVLVSDLYNSRLQLFQPDGTFIRKWGVNGWEDGHLVQPRGVGIDRDGMVCVLDATRVQLFRPDGTYLAGLGSGSDTSLLGSPFGLALATNGLMYVSDLLHHRVSAFQRGYRLPAAGMPLPEVTVSQRVGTAYVDIDFTVRDNDNTNVYVAALAWSNGVTSLDNLVRLSTLIEGTSSNVGKNVAANVPHRLTWDAGSDWKVSFGDLRFEILANDGRDMVDFHFITIPSNGTNPELEIERFPLREADFQTSWYALLAAGASELNFRSNRVYGLKGIYSNKLLAASSGTTDDGRTFLFERYRVRAATTAEVEWARAGTSGMTNQWAPRYTTDPRTAVNEYGFDSAHRQGDGVWYAVPLPFYFTPSSDTKQAGSGFSTTATIVKLPPNGWVKRMAWEVNNDGTDDIVWNRTDTNGDLVIDGNDAGPDCTLSLSWAQMGAYAGLQSVGSHAIKLTVTDNLDVARTGTFWLTITP